MARTGIELRNKMKNGMNKCVFFLLMLLLVMGIRVTCYFLAVYEGRVSCLPESIRQMSTFNDIRGFSVDPENPRKYLVSDDYRRLDHCYLRFVIPNIDPSQYKLVLRMSARADLLKHSMVRSARGTANSPVVGGSIATYEISMKNSTAFLWDDGKCYVGVMFPRSAIKPGDTVELLDFKFELR